MTAGDLTTVANVKSWLNITVSTDDVLLARLVNACSLFIQQYINRTIASASYTELCDGMNTTAISFKNYPVTAVSSLAVDGTTITAASPAATGAGYVFSQTQLMLRGYKFCRGFQNISVTYTAGYASTPADLEQACIELISLRYQERTRIGNVSKTIAGETIAFTQKDMSDDIKTLLNQYKRVVTV